jgi:N-acyl-D-aspartate/D-glutamate deacylase
MSFIFRNARIIDGCGDAQAHGFVVVEKNRIVEVGKGPGPSRKNGH